MFDTLFAETCPPSSEDNPYEIELEDGTLQCRDWRSAGIACATGFNSRRRIVSPFMSRRKRRRFLAVRQETLPRAYVCAYGESMPFDRRPSRRVGDCETEGSETPASPRHGAQGAHNKRCPPSSEWGEWHGSLHPGHFFADDLGRVRLELHAQAFCQKVQLSGVGSLKALRTRDTVILRRLPEAFVCEAFVAAFERLSGS